MKVVERRAELEERGAPLLAEQLLTTGAAYPLLKEDSLGEGHSHVIVVLVAQ